MTAVGAGVILKYAAGIAVASLALVVAQGDAAEAAKG